MAFRQLRDDLNEWLRGFDRLAVAVGARFHSSIAFIVLLLLAPLVSLYAGQALPLILAVALYFSAVHHRIVTLQERSGGLRAASRTRAPAWLWVIGALLLYAAVSASWSLVPQRGALQAVKIASILLVALALHRTVPPLERPWHRDLAAIGIALASVLILLEMRGSGLIRESVYGSNPAFMNRSVVVVSLLAWPALALIAPPLNWLKRLVLLALLSAAVTAAHSLSAAAGLAVGLAAMVMALLSPVIVLALLALATGAAIITIPWSAPLFGRLLEGIGLGATLNLSSLRRLDIWQSFSRVVEDRPLLGWGIEGSHAVGRHADPAEWTVGPVHHPHNPLLQIWVDLGAIGAALAAIALILLVLSIRLLPRERQPFALGCYAAALTIAAVSHGLWQTWWLALLMTCTILFTIQAKPASGVGVGGVGGPPVRV